jgi:DNA-binding beta-propeller fold protein YncE
VQVQEGDGAPAISALLDAPTQIAFGSDGTLYFGEDHGSLRKVDRFGRISTVHGPRVSSGEIAGVAVSTGGEVIFTSNASGPLGQIFRLVNGLAEVVAGSGVAHCCGDGAPAISAPLSKPWGLAVAPDGDLLIADSANDRIRRVSTRTGRISTVAGGGVFALPGSRKILFRPSRSAPPPGRIHAMLFEVVAPRFVANDRAGNVYFCSEDGPVYRIDSRDGTLRALGADRKGGAAGSPISGFRGIGGITVDASGDVIVAAEHRIFRIKPSGGIGLVAGTGKEGFFGDGGFGTLAELSRPAWPVHDGRGTIYFVDSGNYRIRSLDITLKIATVAGNGQSWTSGPGQALRESIGAPTGLAIAPGGELMYAASDNRVYRFSLQDGALSVFAGKEPNRDRPSPDGPYFPDFSLGGPLSIALDSGGAVYFSEPQHDRVRAVRPRP